MLHAVVEKSEFVEFITLLLSQFPVIGPRRKGDRFVLAAIKNFDELALSYDATTLPPKKYFLPPRETLFKFDLNTRAISPEALREEKRIFLGLHACDIHGLQILDLVFAGEFRDSEYFRRRASSIIIGYDCEPRESCFCDILEAEEVRSGFDLFFTELDEDYLVRIGSARGDQLLRRTTRVRRAQAADLELFDTKHKLKRSLFRHSLEAGLLSDFLHLADRQNTWEELAKRCFSCGSCTVVCPTCYCFSTSDEVSLNLKEGWRERSWDSCQSKDFAAVAGHNFRESAAARLRFRFYHKHGHSLEQHGRAFCVGCGRCVKSCLAGIHLLEIIEKTRGARIAETRPSEHALQNER